MRLRHAKEEIEVRVKLKCENDTALCDPTFKTITASVVSICL